MRDDAVDFCEIVCRKDNVRGAPILLDVLARFRARDRYDEGICTRALGHWPGDGEWPAWPRGGKTSVTSPPKPHSVLDKDEMDYRKAFLVESGKTLRLEDRDPSFKGHHETQETAASELEHYRAKLAHQQALLYAERKHSVLVVLQALDAGGKDGTVNHVFTALNPQGTTVVGFKQPTAQELAHDFLWRVHPHAPGRGEIAIFNRYHYEDVLVTRVHKLIDKKTWAARFERILEFEAGLTATAPRS